MRTNKRRAIRMQERNQGRARLPGGGRLRSADRLWGCFVARSLNRPEGSGLERSSDRAPRLEKKMPRPRCGVRRIAASDQDSGMRARVLGQAAELAPKGAWLLAGVRAERRSLRDRHPPRLRKGCASADRRQESEAAQVDAPEGTTSHERIAQAPSAIR